jgi:hypothetical protein
VTDLSVEEQERIRIAVRIAVAMTRDELKNERVARKALLFCFVPAVVLIDLAVMSLFLP